MGTLIKTAFPYFSASSFFSSAINSSAIKVCKHLVLSLREKREFMKQEKHLDFDVGHFVTFFYNMASTSVDGQLGIEALHSFNELHFVRGRSMTRVIQIGLVA